MTLWGHPKHHSINGSTITKQPCGGLNLNHNGRWTRKLLVLSLGITHPHLSWSYSFPDRPARPGSMTKKAQSRWRYNFSSPNPHPHGISEGFYPIIEDSTFASWIYRLLYIQSHQVVPLEAPGYNCTGPRRILHLVDMYTTEVIWDQIMHLIRLQLRDAHVCMATRCWIRLPLGHQVTHCSIGLTSMAWLPQDIYMSLGLHKHLH